MQSSAIVLAGGLSSRMKTNKALVELADGQTMIEFIIRRLMTQFRDIIVVANEPELYEGLPVRVVKDIIPRQGPLSGIHAGLSCCCYDQAVIIGCDMPFFSLELLKYLVSILPGHQAAVPFNGPFLEPLSAAYSRSAAPVIERLLLSGRRRIIWALEAMDCVTVPEEVVASFGDRQRIFANVNTREALEEARRVIGGNMA